jgi:hypothetical protein
VTKRIPSVNFAELTDADITRQALERAGQLFNRNVQDGLTNGDSLIMRVGTADGGDWVEWGCKAFGPDGLDFIDNVNPVTGKLASAVYYQMNSGAADGIYHDEIPADARRYTGAVYHQAYVHTDRKDVMTKVFVAAGSGVQGEFDQASAAAAVFHMAALWAQQQLALHGKPKS